MALILVEQPDPDKMPAVEADLGGMTKSLVFLNYSAPDLRTPRTPRMR